MKELNGKAVHLDEYDINVCTYLTAAEIQGIANQVTPEMTWAERQQVIDMCLLSFATDIPKDELVEIGYDTLLTSGLVADVKYIVDNYFDIEEAIKYEADVNRQLALAIPKIKEALEKYAAAAKK